MVGSRPPKELLLLQLVAAVMAAAAVVERGEAATWCIARSGANATAMQTALDYACGTGVADCVPVQANGLCYLPNTLAAHASYAFNSFYQRSNAAPGACDFAGTATVTITDPSYGSCTYPSSASTAGGTTPTPGTGTPTTPMTGVPMTPMAPPFSSTGGGGLGGLSPPNFGTTLPDSAPVSISPLVSILPSICFGLVVLLLG